MNWALPNSLSAFLCFGVLPIILQYTCLAAKGQDLQYSLFDHHSNDDQYYGNQKSIDSFELKQEESRNKIGLT